MFWGILIGILAVGVFATDLIFDMGEEFLSSSMKEIGVGGVIGVVLGICLFVYVAALVYGMSTLKGRKTLMGLGILTLLLGIGSFSEAETVGAIIPLHLLVGLFVTPAEGEVLAYTPWYGIPYVINGGLMCKLGSFKE